MPSFFFVLTEAINDLIENGFDSAQRVDGWVKRLREAAERSMTPPDQMESMLRDGLAAVYQKLIERGGITRYNAVAKFTLEKVKPALRAELDRRIMASAQLIRLNRAEAIEKTLRRFQGWATSIPTGGTDAASRLDTKTEIRKSLAQLPFEERRVLIDQASKLTASLSQILATHSGAIAAKWKSNWRQPGYNYRPDHKERDSNIYLVKGNWAQEKGFVKPGPDGYYDDITKAGEEVFCRCYILWIYNIKDLPDEMITAKGREEIDRVRSYLVTA